MAYQYIARHRVDEMLQLFSVVAERVVVIYAIQSKRLLVKFATKTNALLVPKPTTSMLASLLYNHDN